MFKEIPGYPNYRINENGIVITRNNHIIRPNNNNNNNRPKILLNKYDDNGNFISRDNKSIHRLVAETFIPNPNNLPIVMHKDNDPLHNHISNLQWGTQKDNVNQCINENRRNIKYKKTIYNISNGEDTIVCHGFDELCKVIQNNHPNPNSNEPLKFGPYKGYIISKTNNYVIDPFHFIDE